jgi:hypothetical protein
MGIFYDSNLVFGWEINSKHSKINLEEMDDIFFPLGIYWVCCTPYYDAPSDDRRYFISLINETTCTLEQLNFLSTGSEYSRVIEAKQFIEKTFGITVGDPTIMSIVNIS